MKKQSWIPVAAIIGVTLLLGFGTRKSENADADLRQTLLTQLKSTHNTKDWFVPANIAVEGLTAEQVKWKDKSGNHSIGQLAYHMVFWNERQLETFRGAKPANFTGNNEETFTEFDKKGWEETVKKLDAVMKDIEKAVEGATDAQLKDWAGTIANISTHNAYHTGQIVYIRKMQGWWDAEKGVK